MAREAEGGGCRNVPWGCPKKVLTHAEPPGYRCTAPRRPSIFKPLVPVVHQILKGDARAPRKQRYTAVRIYRRLRDKQSRARRTRPGEGA